MLFWFLVWSALFSLRSIAYHWSFLRGIACNGPRGHKCFQFKSGPVHYFLPASLRFLPLEGITQTFWFRFAPSALFFFAQTDLKKPTKWLWKCQQAPLLRSPPLTLQFKQPALGKFNPYGMTLGPACLRSLYISDLFTKSDFELQLNSFLVRRLVLLCIKS